MESLIIDNFVDLSFMVALYLASQFEKKLDIFGKIIKRGVADTYKVVFIGVLHSVVWIYFFHPEGLEMWEHVKIILTSYMATVVFYNQILQRFSKKAE